MTIECFKVDQQSEIELRQKNMVAIQKKTKKAKNRIMFGENLDLEMA